MEKGFNLRRNLKLLFFFSMLLFIPLFEMNFYNSSEDPVFQTKLKSSGFWELDEVIIVGNSGWVSAASLDWCSFESGYYIIENVTFRCLDGSGNSLRIEDSDVSFIIRNCTFTSSGTNSVNQDAGLELYQVENGLITQNFFIDNNQNGLYLNGLDGFESMNNTIINNTIKNNVKYGIYFHQSDENEILNNIVKNNSHGIRLHSSVDNTAEENILQNNTLGFSFRYGHANVINNNTVFNNTNDGFYIQLSNLNTISENLIKYNSRYGVYAFDTSSNNQIFTNRFEKNDVHAFDISSGNDWDNGSIGNYWDNYTGTDIDGDGIGEIPYLIPGGIGEQDNYPIWPFLAPIYINGSATGVGAHNWTWASNQLWCKGSGYSYDPYIIEGYTINGNSTTGISCIEIVDSDKFFEIKDCRLYNGGILIPDSGIKLINASNGKIIGNNCSENIIGISLLDNCNNVNISNNIINLNSISIYGKNNCSNIIIQENDITTKIGSSLAGVWLREEITDILIKNNNLTNHTNGIWITDNCNKTIIDNNYISRNTQSGIYINNNCNENTILNNIITKNGNAGSYPAIFMEDYCNYNDVVNNTVTLNYYDAIRLHTNVHNNLIANNTVSSNLRYGIYLATGHNSSVLQNTVYNNSQRGIVIRGTDPFVINNNVTYNGAEGIYITLSPNPTIRINYVTYNGAEGIVITQCSNASVTNNYVYSNGLSSNDHGIYMDRSDNAIVMENVVIKNGNAGISFDHSDKSKCIDNTANENNIGMEFIALFDVIVQDNVVHVNSITGITVMTSVDNITIYRNSIEHSSTYGIQISGCSNSFFAENIISDCGDGIFITSNSDSNNFTTNYIKYNTGYGIRIDSGCDNNYFYYNYITFNHIDALDAGTLTLWNSSSIGNYWSNYSGVDLDNNGIGDIPYEINGPSNAKDFLPIYKNLPLIYIDELSQYTWKWANQFYWCNGSGTVEDPYIIENFVFDLKWHSNRIEIRNSDKYFIIKDCIISNNRTGYIGILLHNSRNGKIIDCTFEFNEVGLKLDDCDNINITSNNAINNLRGISLINSDTNDILGNNINLNGVGLELWQSNYNFIKDNTLQNNEICILEIDCIGNTFVNNACPLEDLQISIIDQVFSSQGFDLTFYVANMTSDPIDTAIFQIWWDGQDVSNDTQNIGGGMYLISLEPITVEEGEDPILLNMSISAPGYANKYFETDISVRPCELIDLLFFEIADQIYTEDHFNLTFYITNATGDGIDFASIQITWDGTNVSTDVQNLGNGLYFISLEPKLVSPGDDPIILDITIEAAGYQDMNYLMEIAVDPESIGKGITDGGGGFPILIPIVIGVSIGGGLSAVGIYLFLRKRKLGKGIVEEEVVNP